MLKEVGSTVKTLDIQTILNYVKNETALYNSTDKSTFALNYPSGDFFYDRWNIKEEFLGTVFENILKVFSDLGETRIIALPPGKCYRSHADIDDRYHLTVCSEKSYLTDLKNDIMYKTDVNGQWYLMDTGRPHSAVNFGSVNRIQIVARKLLTRNNLEKKKYVTLMPSGDGNQEKLRYIFDKNISTWLNLANKEKIIDKVSTTKNLTEISFFIDSNYFTDLIKILPREIKIKADK